MIEPVYILIRTSNRPKYFERMMASIKKQTYKNIVTIVHSDDPRDKYVTGDVILRCPAYTSEFGDGTYNLYNNRLLKAIPSGSGWFHFMDDDDEYESPDVIERLVENSKRDHINVARVKRIMHGKEVIYPRNWGGQKSFQTEIFFLHTDHKGKARWWGNKGGDHHYSKQLTKVLPINWIDNLIICHAQEAKGNGNKLDEGIKRTNYKDAFAPDKEVACLGLMTLRDAIKIRQGEIKRMPYHQALQLEQQGKIKITYYAEFIEKAPPRSILNIR
jgi:glycosyltransferase involved in cell wall biosynthesis